MPTTMVCDGAVFLVLIKVRINRCVCNTLLIFIDPLSPSVLSPSGSVIVDLYIPCYPD